MLELIIITIGFLIGVASFSMIFFASIQKGQWLDMMFDWQNQLREWDMSGTKKGLILSKILGYCELCFSHFTAFIWFWIYIAVILYFIDFNPPIAIFPIWYLLYMSISTNINLYLITKLFKP